MMRWDPQEMKTRSLCSQEGVNIYATVVRDVAHLLPVVGNVLRGHQNQLGRYVGICC